MRFSSCFLALIGTISSVQAIPQHIYGRSLERGAGPVAPRGFALKQATRSQIVDWAAHPRDLRPRSSPLPVLTCPGFVQTGTVPYARFSGVDYNAPMDAEFFSMVDTRELCTKMCELDSSCIGSTYNAGIDGCFKVRTSGVFFEAAFDVTLKGTTCEASGADLSQFPGSSCCTEYRAATP
ncbi:uncharacterized protein MKK02DRAFT_28651 [Dioszegia hungarica]|uniref:Apple domain-containing protein n=1 Tax=Dioszegia hungarica TaxID=4972 RepID=A0AA38H3H9_9TREE|nr:uncharacterized protein MKK02DRAFT_28651 [Dioszegia hungarica]KAI9633902.1 hypothetical protein MKK02DRAFT_28651 [Dioszegia hungarica]